VDLKTWFKKIWSKKDKPEGRLTVEPAYPYVSKTREVKFRFIDPAYPREILKDIELYVMNTPVLSQTHNLIVSLANTGHRVEVEAESEPLKQKAEEELENLAFELNVDTLVFHLFSQLALYGCISAEIVVNSKLDGIEKVVRVHPSTIYFDLNKETQEYEPYQWIGGREPVKLNPITYKYLPLLTIDGSPYAIPPFLAALGIAEAHKQFVEELKSLATKVGLIGFLDVKFPPLPKAPSETEAEYTERGRKFLQNVAQDIAENISKGLLVHFEGTEVNFKEIKADAGFTDILNILEKWQIAGAKGQPALIGFSQGYTETWATVALHVFLKQIERWQNLIEKFLEYTYKLHLALKGIFVEDVNVEFYELPSFHPDRDAETELKKAQTVVSLLQAGVINVEEARKMLELE